MEKKFQSSTTEKAMEGRFIDKDGKDHKDRGFHEKAIGFDSDNDQEQLDKLEEFVIDQKEQRAQELEKTDPEKAKILYKTLLNRYPNHSRATDWKAKS